MKSFQFVIILVWMTSALTVASRSPRCPERCNCWEGTVSCDKGLEAIPSVIQSSYKAMYVRDNHIPQLTKGIFSNDGYFSLQQLHLLNDNVEVIEEDTFQGLNQLSYLEIQNNRIIKLDPNGFQGMENLQTLNLQHNLITEIEPGAFRGLRKLDELDLSNNNLFELDNGVFSDLHVLQKLDLNNNNLEEISAGVFSDVIALNYLILEYNKLTVLPLNVFSKLSVLIELDLSHNQLTSIDHAAFHSLLSLAQLDLSNNEIEYFEPDTFAYLTNLKRLWLHSNKIMTLQPDIFEDSQRLQVLTLHENKLQTLHPKVFHYTSSLQCLRLYGNPWVCDCTLLPLKVWFEDAGKSDKITESDPIYCKKTPSHKLVNKTRLENVPNTWLCNDPAEIHVEGDGTVLVAKTCILCINPVIYIITVAVVLTVCIVAYRMKKYFKKKQTPLHHARFLRREGRTFPRYVSLKEPKHSTLNCEGVIY